MKNKENKAFKESFKKVETVKKHFCAIAVVREFLAFLVGPVLLTVLRSKQVNNVLVEADVEFCVKR